MKWKPEPEVVNGAKTAFLGVFIWGGLHLNICQCFSLQGKWTIFSMVVADMCAYKMSQKVLFQTARNSFA